MRMDQRGVADANTAKQPKHSQAQEQCSTPSTPSPPPPPPPPPTPSSPRRRKTAIDLDAALWLQSQASYVQEPAGGLIQQPKQRQPSPSVGPSSTPVAATSSSSTATTFSGAIEAPHLRPVPLHKCPQTQQQQPQVVNYYDRNYAPSGRSWAPPLNSNISVDYIDCLSNNDLVAVADIFGPGAQPSASLPMRVIPTPCRKHLSRFHRSHRVEPTLDATGARLGAGTHDDSATTTTTTNNNTTTTEDSASGASETPGVGVGPSVLYPISVSEAKKRTYLIGSVSQDSLLSHEELYRYFPTGRVSIFVATWNQNRRRSPSNLNDLLLPDQLVYVPDIYAIGIQEAFSSQADYLRDWEVELQTTLGPSHVLLHSCSLGVLHLSLFIRRDLIWFCSTPEESLYNSRSMPTNMIKTKGAISIAFRFFGTSFMFTNCHFPAHEHRLKDRIDEYQRIINSIDLPKNLKLLKPRYLSNDSTARFDCVFFMGDLNFRLEQRTFDETIQILDDIFQSREQSYEALTQNDELLKVMESQQAFHGFDEGQIKFPPTYKFLAQTNKYDSHTKRVPSYTDRILYRSKRQRHIQCLVYDWLPQMLSSDHKPVYCLFEVLIRPGREHNLVGSMNAGLFQRAVYLEALKRRAEDPDGVQENGASGNLICSIS